MFLRQMTEAFLVRTEPDSSMVKPAHIHMTSAPHRRNDSVFRTNWDSSSMAACAASPVTKRRMSSQRVLSSRSNERRRADCVPRVHVCLYS